MTLKTSDLKAALARVTPVLASRTTLPILSCVKLGNGSIEATSFDEYSTASINGNGNACCVFGQRLASALQFAKGDESELELKDNTLTITSEGREWKLATMPAKEFPDPPKDAFRKIGVNCTDLAECIENVLWAASSNADIRPYWKHCLHVQLAPTHIMAEAGEGGAYAKCQKPSIAVDADIVTPSNFGDGILSALREDGAVLSVGDKYLKVDHAVGSYSCKLAEEQYPNVALAFSETPEPLGKVWVGIMGEALASCAAQEVGTKGVFDRTYVEWGPNGAIIRFKSTDNHAVTADIPGEFAPLKAEINLRNWLKALKLFGMGEVPLSHASNHFVLSNGELTVILAKFKDNP